MRSVIALAAVLHCIGCAALPEPEQGNVLSAGLEGQMNRYIQKVKVGTPSTLFNDLNSLSAFGRHATQPVREGLLVSTDARVRSNAVFVLSSIYRLDGDEVALGAIREAMADQEPSVRLEAARALLEFGDPSGVPELIDGLRADQRGVRVNAALALRDAAGTTFGYNPDGDAVTREAAITRFESWHRG